MDDVISSHVKYKVNYKFKEYIIGNYVKHGEVKANRGKVHKCIIMTFYFTENGKVKIKTDEYVERNINDPPMKISKSDTALTSPGNNIFEKGNRNILGKK